MCYSPAMSFSFFILGILVSIYVTLYDREVAASNIVVLLLFYSAMELLQSVQYHYVNQCGELTNRILTEIAYILVIFQPLIWNWFFYYNSGPCERLIFVTGMALAIVWIAFSVASRILHIPDDEIKRTHSVYAGTVSCTKRKNSHLFWQWPFRNFSDLNPNFLAYLMIWFIPALVSQHHRNTSLVVLVGALVGALMTVKAGELEIFASAWCYISVPIVLVVLLQRKWLI